MTARNLATGPRPKRVIPRAVVRWGRATHGRFRHALHLVGQPALCGYVPRRGWWDVAPSDLDCWAECPKCVRRLPEPITHVTRVVPEAGSDQLRWLCTCGGRSRPYADPAELDRARHAHATVHNGVRR